MKEERWAVLLRDDFPAARQYAFFDIAYENCGSNFSADSVEEYFRHLTQLYPGMIKAGGEGKGVTIEVVRETRSFLASFLGAEDPSTIAFAQNTTQAMNLLLQSFPFEEGDNVVVGDLEHEAVLMPALALRKKGVQCRIARSNDGICLTAEKLLEQVDDRTRVVLVSYVQSRSGYRIDLAKLCRECHKKGIYVFTDAIQALGLIRVNVKKLGVDALVASGYKGLLGMEGMGFLYASPELTGKLVPVFCGASPVVRLDRERMEVICADERDARKFEVGTIPFASIYALREGIIRLNRIGMEKVEAYVSSCVEEIALLLTQMGYQIATPLEKEHRCNILLVCEKENVRLTDFALERGVCFSCGQEGYIRISVAPFTIPEDIEALAAVLREWKRVQSGRE